MLDAPDCGMDFCPEALGNGNFQTQLGIYEEDEWGMNCGGRNQYFLSVFLRP
jgi:hypothetical protein